MTFYNYIENVRSIAIDLTNGKKWRGASDKVVVFDALDAARWEYMCLSDENSKLQNENSILRKYVSKALSIFSYCDYCPYVDCECDTETVPMHKGCKAFEELRELGIDMYSEPLGEE